MDLICNGNRTEWSPIHVCNEYEWLTKSVDRVWLQTELDDTKFCYQLIITLTKFVIYKALSLNQNNKFQDHFLASSEKKSHVSARDGAYCPIT